MPDGIRRVKDLRLNIFKSIYTRLCFGVCYTKVDSLTVLWLKRYGMTKKKKQARHGTKDSVFTHLFSIPKYQLQLYKTLHPEDKHVKASDIETITKKCVVAQHEHNDLGILVKDTLMILVEAQSSWSPNIVIRLMSYAVQSLMDYFEEREVFLYGNSKAVCPRIELYVIYTGQRHDEPETLTFKELFFAANERCDLDATVNMIYYKTDKTDIINQYIMFCRVFNEQIKQYSYSETALKETLRICRDKEILTQYIIQRESEIMNIMTALFDQDYITRMYGVDQRREGKEEGKKEGKEETALKMLKKGMDIGIISEITDLSAEEIEAIAKQDEIK